MAYKKKQAPRPASLVGRLYSPEEAANYLGGAAQTLAYWRRSQRPSTQRRWRPSWVR